MGGPKISVRIRNYKNASERPLTPQKELLEDTSLPIQPKFESKPKTKEILTPIVPPEKPRSLSKIFRFLPAINLSWLPLFSQKKKKK